MIVYSHHVYVYTAMRLSSPLSKKVVRLAHGLTAYPVDSINSNPAPLLGGPFDLVSRVSRGY